MDLCTLDKVNVSIDVAVIIPACDILTHFLTSNRDVSIMHKKRPNADLNEAKKKKKSSRHYGPPGQEFERVLYIL